MRLASSSRIRAAATFSSAEGSGRKDIWKARSNKNSWNDRWSLQRKKHCVLHAKSLICKTYKTHRLESKEKALKFCFYFRKNYLPETSSVPSVNISRVNEEICPVRLEILDSPPVRLSLNHDMSVWIRQVLLLLKVERNIAKKPHVQSRFSGWCGTRSSSIVHRVWLVQLGRHLASLEKWVNEHCPACCSVA